MMIAVSQLTYTHIYICSYVPTFVALPVTNCKIFLFTFLFFTVSLWYPFCAVQADGLYDRLWIRPLWLPSEVWESNRNLGTAVQKLVWKFSIKSCCRVRYVRDGCCLSCFCFMVLLDNIIITVSITYLLNVTVVKRYLGKHQMSRNCIHEKFKSTLQ